MGKEMRHRLIVFCGAVALTLMFFLVLPLMQTINKPPSMDLTVQSVDTANVPPPPSPPEEEPDEEEEPEEQPPELTEEAPPLDLSQLELALNPGFSDSWMSGDFTVNLQTVASADSHLDSLFSMADLDQKPRVIYQPVPVMNKRLRQKMPGTVYVIFIVDPSGRVVRPIVQKSTDPIFEKPALVSIKKWKFEPGKNNGKPVSTRMRIPISFQKGQ